MSQAVVLATLLALFGAPGLLWAQEDPAQEAKSALDFDPRHELEAGAHRPSGGMGYFQDVAR